MDNSTPDVAPTADSLSGGETDGEPPLSMSDLYCLCLEGRLNVSGLCFRVLCILNFDGPQSAGELADRLNTSRQGVYNALETLADRGLVERSPHESTARTARHRVLAPQ